MFRWIVKKEYPNPLVIEQLLNKLTADEYEIYDIFPLTKTSDSEIIIIARKYVSNTEIPF